MTNDLPKVHNTRSPEQWEIISKHIDFKGKTVLDLGCGYGDILLKCQQSGAAEIWGVEQDWNICNTLWISGLGATVYNADLEQWINSDLNLDIVICFSVLPYLNHPFTVLEWIKEHSQIALIEMQYAGDGPGPELIRNDGDMGEYLLQVGFESVEAIGKTLVEGRDKWRTIWLCR